jgi:hypothetical protein
MRNCPVQFGIVIWTSSGPLPVIRASHALHFRPTFFTNLNLRIPSGVIVSFQPLQDVGQGLFDFGVRHIQILASRALRQIGSTSTNRQCSRCLLASIIAGSVFLVGFGGDSLIEVASWRSAIGKYDVGLLAEDYVSKGVRITHDIGNLPMVGV